MAPFTINSWSPLGEGPSSRSCAKSFSIPFKANGIKITEAEYDYGLAKIRAMVDTKTVSWDVVYTSESGVRQMCEEGIIETIDWKRLGLDPANFEGTYSDCGVPAILPATVVAYDKNRLPNGPETIADFFDLKNFPGKRVSIRVPSRMGSDRRRAHEGHLQRPAHAGGRRSRVQEARHDQERDHLVDGRGSGAAASRRRSGRYE
ncbi:extracellular solute-binding protein [Bradyrhizobium sp. WSM 1791]|uniref:Extracellular solute-binding protein n=1 Tax=Bradyrhizobium australiense TaxID=2721161 RepID=A0A7Y4GZN2_9BRAD|nr:extracellular solute-binding protein [Bradyrhizobium australiense]